MCRGPKVLMNVPNIFDGEIIGFDRADIDYCLEHVISELNMVGAFTKSCCCGHGERPGSILLVDGTEIKLPVISKSKLPFEQGQKRPILRTSPGSVF